MKHTLSLFLLSLCLFFAVGCEKEEAPASHMEIALNVPFSLKPPQQGKSADIGVKVLQIADSRCPLDANCIWEGEVSVTLNVQTATDPREVVLTLHRPEVDAKNTTIVGAYRLTLEWVSMPPSADSGWKLENYELRLLVSRI